MTNPCKTIKIQESYYIMSDRPLVVASTEQLKIIRRIDEKIGKTKNYMTEIKILNSLVERFEDLEVE